MPTGQVAHGVPEFFETVAQVTNACLHFHFFEARLRLERPTNDFSKWLGDLGENGLARRIDRLNPYAMTLDELKHEIVGTEIPRKIIRRGCAFCKKFRLLSHDPILRLLTVE